MAGKERNKKQFAKKVKEISAVVWRLNTELKEKEKKKKERKTEALS